MRKKITPNNWFHDINTTEQTKQKDPILQTDWNFLNSTRISLFKSYAAKNIAEKFPDLFKNQTWYLTVTIVMPQPPTKKILPAGPTSLIRTIDFDLLCRQFRCFLFLYFLYKKAIRNLRKIWKQFENFTFNFRQNLFRESTSFNKEHKFLVQCHLKTGIHCFVASTEVGFSLQEDIGFNFLTKFWNQSSKFTLCLNLNHFFELVFFGENIPVFSCCSGSHIFETQMPG